MTQRCDVVVVGAGIAGCTAAIAYARAGLRVVLLEAHRDIKTFKRSCTHLIQSSAVPTLRRLGLEKEIENAGGIRNELEFYTAAGWVSSPRVASGPDSTYGYNIRRSELDPLLRRVAMETEGVDLWLGARLQHLTRVGKRVTGVVVRDGSGDLTVIEARLTVGADGRHSTVATQAKLPTVRSPHGRFGVFAHYAGVRDHTGSDYVNRSEGPAQATSRLWLLDPDVAYLLANDGRTVLASMVPSNRMDDCVRDLDGHLRSVFSRLPKGPDLSGATRVSKVTPIKKYENVSRIPVGSGLALIGDAAMVTDYLWGAGCGWAFQGAELLTDATIDPLVNGTSLTPALRTYAWRYARQFGAHQAFNSNFATGRRMNVLERVLFGAATHDDRVAARVGEFGSRTLSPIRAFTPPLLTRAWRSYRALGAG